MTARGTDSTDHHMNKVPDRPRPVKYLCVVSEDRTRNLHLGKVALRQIEPLPLVLRRQFFGSRRLVCRPVTDNVGVEAHERNPENAFTPKEHGRDQQKGPYPGHDQMEKSPVACHRASDGSRTHSVQRTAGFKPALSPFAAHWLERTNSPEEDNPTCRGTYLGLRLADPYESPNPIRVEPKRGVEPLASSLPRKHSDQTELRRQVMMILACFISAGPRYQNQSMGAEAPYSARLSFTASQATH